MQGPTRSRTELHASGHTWRVPRIRLNTASASGDITVRLKVRSKVAAIEGDQTDGEGRASSTRIGVPKSVDGATPPVAANEAPANICHGVSDVGAAAGTGGSGGSGGGPGIGRPSFSSGGGITYRGS